MTGYTFIARSQYAGRCAGCDEPYAEGDPIWWTRGGPCYHKDCEPAEGDAAAGQESRGGRTGATTAGERQTGTERSRRAAVEAIADRMANAERQAAACVRAVAALTRAVLGLADALGAQGTVSEHLAEVETALRTLTDPHADAKAAQAAGGSDDGDQSVPF